MVGCTLYSALDLVDGHYQLLMQASDIPLTAVRTPSGMLWEWLVMPQGLSNAPATFNRLLTQLFRPDRGYAQTYFDDIFVHSRSTNGRSDVDNLINHVRAVLECMRTNKLYASAFKCIFGAEEIPFLGCFIGKRGLRADPAKAVLCYKQRSMDANASLHSNLDSSKLLKRTIQFMTKSYLL
uniref:RxLR effector candidate protein n=1 Tax=Hyaloperonospora arabidopsidis (strain Emoy2) TaxID=559515 RepID=A0A090BBN7_HYAAE|nr:RxLR effector candidate protein [Hyaloperonospora arabidopsidis Emoy2]